MCQIEWGGNAEEREIVSQENLDERKVLKQGLVVPVAKGASTIRPSPSRAIDKTISVMRRKNQATQGPITVPNGSVGKESTCTAGAAGDAVSIPGSGRSPGGGNGNPLQYSCWKNPIDRGAWQAIVHGVGKELDMT